MFNYKENIEDLYFHDSNIISLKLEDGDFFQRKLTVLINYYNWEGNKEEKETWTTKTLVLNINHCVHLQVNAPNLMEDTFEIMSHEFDEKYQYFLEKAQKEQSESYFINLRKKKLKNFLSLKFKTNNYGDSHTGETAGFIWLAGFNVSHEWLEDKIVGKKHISI